MRRATLNPFGNRRSTVARVYAEETLNYDQSDELAATERAFYSHIVKRMCLLPPLGSKHGVLRARWSKMLLLLALYEASYVPFMAAFRMPTTNSVFELPLPMLFAQWVIDALFWVDVLLMFRTTRAKEEFGDPTELETDTRTLADGYLHSTFALDIFSLLPSELLALVLAPEAGGVLPTLCGHTALALRLNRVVHAHRVISYHGKSVLKLSRMRRLLFFWCACATHAHAAPSPHTPHPPFFSLFPAPSAERPPRARAPS